MRVVFMGTPEFAVPSLVAAARDHHVVAALTRPDAVSGRGSSLRPSPVGEAARAAGIPVFQPTTLRDTAVHRHLADLAPDVVIVAAYGLLLPKEVLDIPQLGCVNIHASLLPRWRGAAPIHRAVLAGDSETGVSIMRMEEGLDTGPYCVVMRTQVADKTVADLTTELSDLGALALSDALAGLRDGTCEWVEQDEALATYAEKITKSEVILDPALRVSDALRRIRASTPQAPSRAVIADRSVTVLAAGDADAAVPARAGSAVASKTGVLLGLDDGCILVTRLKPSGKSAMSAADWARGIPASDALTWTAPR